MTVVGHGRFIIVLATAALIYGCSKAPEPVSSSVPTAATDTPAITKTKSEVKVANTSQSRVSNRAANTKGAIFVAMYHHLGESKDPMFRTAEKFANDLERMDKLGFRPVTVSQYLSNKMDLAPGATPVVMTFDDSNPDQLRLNADGTLDPTCFMGIWSKFATTHPEFPLHATFFVLPDVMFGQTKMRDQKLALIQKWGSEIGNHTVDHLALRKLPEDKVQYQIVKGDEDLKQWKIPHTDALALPYGSNPHNHELLKKSTFQGQSVSPTGVFLVGANPAKSPEDPKFDKLSIARIQANDGELGLSYWLDQVDKGKIKLYVAP